MHVYYKFGLFLIFILSVSTCYVRAAPATNHSSSYEEDYPDDYDDYYDDTETDTHNSTDVNRLISGTTTTKKPLLLSNIDLPKRSNHVLEPNCPKTCRCMEDYKYIQCSNGRLTRVPNDIPSTALIIDLSNNRINELLSTDFSNCTKVREINLSGNEITDIKKEVFWGLRRLQRLRLANNRLTDIDPDAFTGANDLNSLDLSNNTIALYNNGSFLNQPELLELSCRNCSWSELYDDTFSNLSSLTTLKLDQNNFNLKFNTKAFTPLRNLIKLRLPELDQTSIQQLCNLLKSIDNISFKHFDISCFELVLGASFNESLIFATDPPYSAPLDVDKLTTTTTAVPVQKIQETKHKNPGKVAKNMTNTNFQTIELTNITLPNDNSSATNDETILAAGVLPTNTVGQGEQEEKPYQVPISQEAINIMLISIMVVAVIGLIIGIICRKDIGGIKTKCCRTKKPEPKDQVHPTEEIPLNKLS